MASGDTLRRAASRAQPCLAISTARGCATIWHLARGHDSAGGDDCYAGQSTGAVAGVVGIESGVVSGVFNLESSGVRASDWRPRHDKRYHKA